MIRPYFTDPDNYLIRSIGNKIELEQQMNLEAIAIKKCSIDLELKRTIMPCRNSLVSMNRYDDDMKEISYFGFSHLLELNEMEIVELSLNAGICFRSSRQGIYIFL